MAIRAYYTLNGIATRFSFPNAVRDISELKVLYSPDPFNAGPPITPNTGTEVIPTGNWTAEGIGTRSAGVEIDYPNVPTSGTLIVLLLPVTTRVTGPYSFGVPPTPSALNEEFDHYYQILQSIVGGVDLGAIDLSTIDTRIDTLETTSADQEARISTNETDIADLDARALLEDTGDGKFDAESKEIKNVGAPTNGSSAARLADVSAAIAGFPSKVGNAGKSLRVSNDELAEVWEDVQADEVLFDGTASGLAATEVQGAIDEHIADALDAHDASAISVVPTGNLGSVNVQAGLEELQGDINGLNGSLAAKVSKAGDSMTGLLSLLNPATYGVEIVRAGGNDSVIPFRSTAGGFDEGYVGKFRAGPVDIMGIGNPGVLGPNANGADLMIDDNGQIYLRRDGRDSSLVAVRQRFYTSVGLTINNGGPNPFLILHSIGGIRKGTIRVRGYVTLDKNNVGQAHVYVGVNRTAGTWADNGFPGDNLGGVTDVFKAPGNNNIFKVQLLDNAGYILPFEFSTKAIGNGNSLDIYIGESNGSNAIVRQFYFIEEVTHEGDEF